MYISLWIKLGAITVFCAVIVLISVVFLVDAGGKSVAEGEKIDLMYEMAVPAVTLQQQFFHLRQLTMTASQVQPLRRYASLVQIPVPSGEAIEGVAAEVPIMESVSDITESVYRVFSDILEYEPHVASIAYVDESGEELLKMVHNRNTGDLLPVNSSELKQLQGEAYVQKALDSRDVGVLTDVEFIDAAAMHFRYVTPVFDDQEVRRGILVMRFYTADVVDPIFSRLEGQDFFLLDKNFRTVVGQADVSILLNLHNTNQYHVEIQPGVAASIGKMRDVQGRELEEFLYLFSVSYDSLNPEERVLVGRHIPAEGLLRNYYSAARTVIIGVTGIMIVLLSIYILFLYFSTRVLWQIYDVLRSYESGDYSAEVMILPNNELGHIAKVVNGLIALARGADKDRYDFITSASHQLRTPVSAIRMQIDTLKEDLQKAKVPRRIVNQIEDIEVQNRRSISVMNTLLKYLEIGEKYKPEEKRDIVIDKMITHVLETHADDIAEKKLKVSVNIPKGISVLGHAAAIRTTFNHLIANALDYSHDGGTVEIRVTKEGGEMVFSVRDEGIGIPYDEVDGVFEKFFRASNAYLKRNVGSGLGLVIAKKVVEAHGGDIWFKSKEGEGTTFFVSLPFG